ncbi:MAG TPA: enoyl-CoA hydratase/isomerase family protein [Egicoccus sp.]|nr:enoyl-CoA hydratase/isomerase family protein [Egicoccus sp.]HSK23321.1 enoyl-CoA hydratase/isomerase family protein [Egicoccus sp.]
METAVEGMRIETADGVATATLARAPENLLTGAICRALTELLLRPPPQLHVLRLRAEGRVFCLGRERVAEDVGSLRDEVQALVALNLALRDSPVVSVAEVHGDAAGFGVGLAALCDVTVAAASARFWFPEVEIDLAPTVVLSWLPRLVGTKTAVHLTATGRRVDAAEAARLGLVTSVVDDGDLATTVDIEVERLRGLSPHVHGQIKAFTAQTADLTTEQAYVLATERLILGSMARRRE